MESQHHMPFSAVVAEPELVRLLANHAGQLEIRRHGSYRQSGHESST
jgi:hypothetical protein